jgi:hypothetical protein
MGNVDKSNNIAVGGKYNGCYLEVPSTISRLNLFIDRKDMQEMEDKSGLEKPNLERKGRDFIEDGKLYFS